MKNNQFSCGSRFLYIYIQVKQREENKKTWEALRQPFGYIRTEFTNLSETVQMCLTVAAASLQAYSVDLCLACRRRKWEKETGKRRRARLLSKTQLNTAKQVTFDPQGTCQSHHGLSTHKYSIGY